jgi:hypothetical protein
MGNPSLPGKRVTTLNLVEADIEVARGIAAARGVATAAVLREAIRVGLPLLLKRDASLFPELPSVKDVSKTPSPAARRKHDTTER